MLRGTLLIAFACVAAFPCPGLAQDDPTLASKLDATTARIVATQKQLQAAAKKQAELQEQLSQTAAMLKSGKAALGPLLAEQQKLQQRFDKAKQEADRLKVLAVSARKRRDTHAGLVASLTGQLNGLRQQLGVSQRAATTAKKQLDAATADMASQQAVVKKAQAASKIAADKLAKAKQAHEVNAKKTAVAKKGLLSAETSRKQAAESTAATAKGVASATKAIDGLIAAAKAAPKNQSAQQAATTAADTLVQLKSAVAALKEVETATAAQVVAAAAIVKAAEQAETKSKAAMKPLEDGAKKAAAALKSGQGALAAATGKVAAAKATISKSRSDQLILNTQINGLAPSVRKATAELKHLENQWVQQQKQANSKLGSIGLFTSFSNEVAPIFSKKCMACHNTHEAGGQFDMDTFASILKGGESGSVVHAGKSSESYLFELIVDGSMPQDADPLTPDEIAVVRRWIDNGAGIDPGFDPAARLVEIMPKAPHPNPPATYTRSVPVTALAFSPDEKVIASSGHHEVLLWDASNGNLLQRIVNVAERIHEIEFSADGTMIAVAAGTPAQVGEVKLFRAADGKLLGDFVRTDDSVFSVALSPDGKRIAIGAADNRVRIFDVATGSKLLDIDEHADWVMDVAWSPDGRQIASASRDKTAKLFNSVTGEPLWTLNGHTQTVYSVCFSSNGRQLVTASGDRDLKVWNGATGKMVRRIRGYGNEIFRVALTPDGHSLSVSADQTARLHNISNGKELKRFNGHSDWVYSLAVGDSGVRVATGGYDGEVRVWDAKEAKILVRFEARPTASDSKTTAAR